MRQHTRRFNQPLASDNPWRRNMMTWSMQDVDRAIDVIAARRRRQRILVNTILVVLALAPFLYLLSWWF